MKNHLYQDVRTNYFRAKNKDDFILFFKFIAKGNQILEDEQGRVGIIFDKKVGLPDSICSKLASFLDTDEVAIVICIQRENIHSEFLTGFAVSVNDKCETVSVDLNQIYDLSRKLGKTTTVLIK